MDLYRFSDGSGREGFWHPEARESVRQMVQEIRLTPLENVLAIDVKGNVAAILASASQTRTAVSTRFGCEGSQPPIPTAVYAVSI
jgi:hypothetical protein